MNTRELVDGGETLTVEFKAEINDRDLTKAVACMANGRGGVVLVGINDDGTLRGAKPRHGDETFPDRVAAYIQANTEPALPVQVILEDLDGIAILRIDVPIADPGPVGTKHGLFTRRVLDTNGMPACIPMTAHEIVSVGMLTRGQDFAAAVAKGATFEDLDHHEFDRFRELCSRSGDDIAHLSDEDLLKALGLTPLSDPVSLGAILLFGHRHALSRWLPNAEFLFQDARSTEGGVNERIVAPLLKVAEYLKDLIDQRNEVTELIVGLQRIDVPLIPSITRREAVANALIHRDYAVLGPTVVQITDDSFVVTSPGGFPPGVDVSNILDQSRPRSPILAAAFKRAGLVERRGKGVNEMYEQQLRAGRDTPDYSRSNSFGVTVIVSLSNADLDLVRFLLSWEDDNQKPLKLNELRAVHEVKSSGSATSVEIAERLNALPATARNTLAKLVEFGILEARGVGRSRRYHLTARFYDLAKDRNAYVRLIGADPMQQERMVLDYVRAYGSITRSQAAQLCQTSPTQGRSILKKLVEDNRLVIKGERRGARYVVPSASTE